MRDERYCHQQWDVDIIDRHRAMAFLEVSSAPCPIPPANLQTRKMPALLTSVVTVRSCNLFLLPKMGFSHCTHPAHPPLRYQLRFSVSYFYTLIIAIFQSLHTCVCAQALQPCPTLCDPVDYSLPGALLENPWDCLGKYTGWVAISLLQGIFPHPGTEPRSPLAPALADRFFTTEPPGKHLSLLSSLGHTKPFQSSLSSVLPPTKWTFKHLFQGHLPGASVALLTTHHCSSDGMHSPWVGFLAQAGLFHFQKFQEQKRLDKCLLDSPHTQSPPRSSWSSRCCAAYSCSHPSSLVFSPSAPQSPCSFAPMFYKV